MKILITGGAGFIGSSLADRLLELNNVICVIDNFDPYYDRLIKEQNIRHNLKNKNYKFIEGDIRDTDLIETIIKKNNIDIIFHLAARPGVRFSVEDPYSYHDLNVNGMLSILKASMATKIKKIIYASSSSVYGIAQYLPINENHPTIPISPYGASKLAAEAFCNSFMEVFKIPIISLRYFTVYGPRQRPDMAIYKFFNMILKEKEIIIYGDGKQTRDFTYVSDIIEGTIKTMDSHATGVFNLGSGCRITVNDLVRLIEKVVDKKANIKYVKKQEGDMKDTWADINKAKKTFGYKPKVNIKDGIKLFNDWFENVISNNPNL